MNGRGKNKGPDKFERESTLVCVAHFYGIKAL